MNHGCEQPGIAPALPFDGAVRVCALDPVIGLDRDLCVVSWNGAASDLYGISAKDAIGRLFTELITCHPQPLRRRQSPNGARSHTPALESAGLVDGPAIH